MGPLEQLDDRRKALVAGPLRNRQLFDQGRRPPRSCRLRCHNRQHSRETATRLSRLRDRSRTPASAPPWTAARETFSGSSIASSGGLTPGGERACPRRSRAQRAPPARRSSFRTATPRDRRPDNSGSVRRQLDLVDGDRLLRLDVGLGQLAVLEREQLLEQARTGRHSRKLASRRLREAHQQRRELGVERVDAGRAGRPVTGTRAPPRPRAARPRSARRDARSPGAAGARHEGSAPSRARGTGDGRGRVAGGRPDLHQDGPPPSRWARRSPGGWFCREPSPGRRSRSGRHPEHLVELELCFVTWKSPPRST